MALFTDIAQKYNLTPESEKPIEPITPQQEQPRIGDISFGGFFGDIAQKFNLAKPQELVKPKPLVKNEIPGYDKMVNYVINQAPKDAVRVLGVVGEAIDRTFGLPGYGVKKVAEAIGLPGAKEIPGGFTEQVEKAVSLTTGNESLGKIAGFAAAFIMPGPGEEAKALKAAEALRKTKAVKTEINLSKELQPLAQEARKYKSAEEFIKKINALPEKEYTQFINQVAPDFGYTGRQGLGLGARNTIRRYEYAIEFGKPPAGNIKDFPMVDRYTTQNGKIKIYRGVDSSDKIIGKGDYVTPSLERANKFGKKIEAIVPISDIRVMPGGEMIYIGGEYGKDMNILKSQLTDFYNQATRIKEVKPEVITGAEKERGFAKTVRQAPETPTIIKKTLKEEPITYEPIPIKRDIEAAQIRVKESPEKAKQFLYDSDSIDMTKSGGEITATGVELMRHYAKTKDFTQEIFVLDNLAEKLTKAGQQINAAKLYTQMSPEGALLKAQKIANRFNKGKFFWQKDIKLTEDFAKNVWNVADQMRKATGDAKIELGWELERLFNSLEPAGLLKRISVIQTVAQLLNPKTLVTRNPLGNEMFFRLKRISTFAATPIDMVKSVITGRERTITFRTVNQGEFWKNWLTGLKAGWKGVSPAGLGTQFEVYAPVFKAKWNPLTYLEKTLGATLKSFDFAAYSRAKNQKIGELGYLKALNEGLKGEARITAAKKYASEADNNLLQIADNYGKYITFQDNNVVSVGLQKFKKNVLNVGQDFGLGDLIIKYPKTPGSLLVRGLEYSPAGILKAAYLIAKPLLKGKVVNDAEVISALSDAVVGMLGTTALGWYLADKGIITGEAPTDKDIAALEKGIGGGQYRINLSALRRWVMSGFKEIEIKEDDRMYSYDWAQPIALSLSLGANANQQMKQITITGEKRGPLAGAPGTIVSSLGGAIETITEQPVVQGIKRFFGGYDLIGSVEATIESMPSSFTPTILNQIRQFGDPISKETYSPSMLQRAVNRVKARIPILAKELPIKYDTLGNKIEFPPNPNLFNVFLNPGFISRYKPTEAAKMVLQIYNESGETKQIPRVAPRFLTFQGKKVELEGKQISTFQKHIGKKTELIFGELARSGFKEASNSEKVNILNYTLTKIYSQEKYSILTQEQRRILISSFNDKQKELFAKDLANSLGL